MNLESVSAGAQVRSPGRAFLVALRPRQWPKNVLVLAAPATAGVLAHRRAALDSLAALVIFVAASASTYLFNDARDAEADRLHPHKRHRPIASGELAVALAMPSAFLLGGLALLGAGLVSTQLLVLIGTYLVLSYLYNLGAKRVPVIELAIVASGFVLRASAGGAAAHVAISPWFLIVTSAGAMFVVAGKRSAELEVMGDAGAEHRAVLEHYPAGFLLVARVVAASVAVTAYCLWVFERSTQIRIGHAFHNMVWFELSIIPMVLAFLSVELAIETGRGGEPEDLALHDRALQVLGSAWIVLIVLGIYA